VRLGAAPRGGAANAPVADAAIVGAATTRPGADASIVVTPIAPAPDAAAVMTPAPDAAVVAATAPDPARPRHATPSRAPAPDAAVVAASAPDAAPPRRATPSRAPVKEGTIDAEAVFRVLVGSERVQRCYLDAVKQQPTLGGKLIAKATIGVDGRARDVNAIGVSTEVSRCIAKVIASLTFPHAVGGPVEVNIPMSFDPPDPQAVASGHAITTRTAGADDMPTAVEIADGTRALAAAVAPCADSWHGSAHVQLDIAPDGHVRQAIALGSVAGSAAGACIEKTAITKGHFASSVAGTTTTVVIDLP
jgi:hypothetical protein